jgi:hypothetical protein
MLVNDYIITILFLYACAQVTETIYRRMQRKGSMLVNYSPLPDHALPNFFRPVSAFFCPASQAPIPHASHTPEILHSTSAPYILHTTSHELQPTPYTLSLHPTTYALPSLENMAPFSGSSCDASTPHPKLGHAPPYMIIHWVMPNSTSNNLMGHAQRSFAGDYPAESAP